MSNKPTFSWLQQGYDGQEHPDYYAVDEDEWQHDEWHECPVCDAQEFVLRPTANDADHCEPCDACNGKGRILFEREVFEEDNAFHERINLSMRELFETMRIDAQMRGRS